MSDEDPNSNELKGSKDDLLEDTPLISDASELRSKGGVIFPTSLGEFLGHVFAYSFESRSHDLRGGIMRRSVIPFFVREPYKGEVGPSHANSSTVPTERRFYESRRASASSALQMV
ncbi:hypothetical protein E4U60_002675 [Claviceps pazoutovae]|uniref:Uncharacterized protein n=1 Tax=Claviceps pazoutovae TaxID=1649127 RepID=A0A9P7MB33_9HYPO|nr:hypothetical protein E4U60_002675 [Claviceps pazoutovae]